MAVPDTIVAIATPPGTGGIGILRLSGPSSHAISETISRSTLDSARIQFRKFYANDGEVIDHGVCLYFKSPHSFSGEDCVELQAHGGPVVLDMLLERLCELGARLARAGEFSERAFLNGRLDLTQAEAIADLINSGSRAASRAAFRSLDGQFSKQIHSIVDGIVSLRVFVEAALDFSEEEIDFLDNQQLVMRLDQIRHDLSELLARAEQGRTLQEGLNVSLAGLPNAGKSSLLNFLVGHDAAIVTEIAGTTRDILREQVSLRGVPVRLHDTAGLRDSTDPIEREGVRRAREQMETADLVLYLVDASQGLSADDEENLISLPADRTTLVYSKSDLLPQSACRNDKTIYLSTLTEDGMERLIDVITGHTDFNQDNHAIMARRRHVDALLQAKQHLQQASDNFAHKLAPELIAEDLRAAQQCLNQITGEFSSDDLLGEIFSSFCVGK